MSDKLFFERKPLLYLITEGRATSKNFSEKSKQILNLVKIAAQNKISLIQIREKNLSAKLVFELAAEAVKITRSTETKILINDRADIALAADAHGVHLTSRSLSVQTIRRNFPAEFIVGVSAHTFAEAENAEKDGADFVTFSPIFAVPEKGAPKGLNVLREVCEKLKPFPILALGGVDETNFQTVSENGASGFAAIRFLNDAENLTKINNVI